MTTATKTHITKCTRCGGSGQTGFTVDNGVCYKCEGLGVVGGTLDERIEYVENRKKANAQIRAIDGVRKYFKVAQLSEKAAVMPNCIGEFIIPCGKNVPALFEVTYVDDYGDVIKCWGALSKEVLKLREILTGHFCEISKLSETSIIVKFK